MEKSELIQSAKKQFNGLSDVNSDDFNFSLESAIYYLATNYHSGQWSDLYSILSTSNYQPGKLENYDSWRECDFEGALIYDHLVETFNTSTIG